jgi:Right handed beta helix region
MENTMSRLSPAVLALSLMAAVAATPAEAALRAFVSSSGNDANTASGCGVGAPCRSFASAQTVVSDGGEIVALDAAGYGPITITKNVTIVANPGFYAGIAVASGDGVTIATAGINVTLRGLNINGTGGNNGVVMTNGNRLSIENCVISNFPGNGVDVGTAATVRVVDSLIRDNGGYAFYLHGGATASISGTRFLGGANYAVRVEDTTATTTTAVIDNSVFSGNFLGAYAYGGTGTAKVRVTNTTFSNNLYGIGASGGGGTGVLTIGYSMVADNGTGWYQTGGGTVETMGNNIFRNPGNTGALTSVALQ